jgi:hypothetical protein
MLLEELKLLVKNSQHNGCAVGYWVQEQDQELQEIIEAIKTSPNSNLTQALILIKKYHPNAPFKRTSFNYHMRGTCSCQTA